MSPITVPEKLPTSHEYRFFIDVQWKDIHHSRTQEWIALGIIIGIHIAVFQLMLIFQRIASIFQVLFIIGMVISFGFSAFGIMLTCRHRRLIWIKLNWIIQAEEKLGLIQDETNQAGIIPKDKTLQSKISGYQSRSSGSWNRLLWPRLLSTDGLIIAIYLLLILFDGIVFYWFFII